MEGTVFGVSRVQEALVGEAEVDPSRLPRCEMGWVMGGLWEPEAVWMRLAREPGLTTTMRPAGPTSRSVVSAKGHKLVAVRLWRAWRTLAADDGLDAEGRADGGSGGGPRGEVGAGVEAGGGGGGGAEGVEVEGVVHAGRRVAVDPVVLVGGGPGVEGGLPNGSSWMPIAGLGQIGWVATGEVMNGRAGAEGAGGRVGPRISFSSRS